MAHQLDKKKNWRDVRLCKEAHVPIYIWKIEARLFNGKKFKKFKNIEACVSTETRTPLHSCHKEACASTQRGTPSGFFSEIIFFLQNSKMYLWSNIANYVKIGKKTSILPPQIFKWTYRSQFMYYTDCIYVYLQNKKRIMWIGAVKVP